MIRMIVGSSLNPTLTAKVALLVLRIRGYAVIQLQGDPSKRRILRSNGQQERAHT